MKYLLFVLVIAHSTLSISNPSDELNNWLDSTFNANKISWGLVKKEFAEYATHNYKKADNLSGFLRQFNTKKRFKGAKAFELNPKHNYPALKTLATTAQQSFESLEAKLLQIIFDHELEKSQNAFTYSWVYINHLNNLPLNDTRPNDLAYEMLELKGFMNQEELLFEKIGLLILTRKIFLENSFMTTEMLLRKNASETDLTYDNSKGEKQVFEEKETVDFVEVEPAFVGGLDNMTAFIVLNVSYPEYAKSMGEQGIVYVKFVVEKNGEITNVAIRKGVSTSLDTEGIRIIESMPNWLPGSQKNKPVRVNFTIPIHFRLG